MKTPAPLAVAALAAVVLGACPGEEGGSGPDAAGSATAGLGDSAETPQGSPTAGKRKKGGRDKPDVPRVDPPAGFEVVSAKAWTRCNAGAPLAGSCPTIVPKTRRNYLVETFGKPGGRFGVVEMSSGAARDNPQANAPPGFSHVVLEAGEPRFLIDFGSVGTTGRLSDALLQQSRSGAVGLGRRKWGGRGGRLLLAEAFPGGGAHGDHLIFQWERGGVIHRISLHAWVPVDKARAALKKIVVSMR